MYVYLITNLINGKYYVGQHSGKDLKKYLQKKLMYANQNTLLPLHRAILKYGIDSFSIQSLAEVNTKEELDNLEKLWIAVLDSTNKEIGYNLTLGGGGHLGFTLSEETRKLLSLSKLKLPNHGMSEKCTEAKKEFFKTYVVSEETRKKLSIAGKGKLKSEEWKNKIRDAQKGRPLSEEHKAALRRGWAERKRLKEDKNNE